MTAPFHTSKAPIKVAVPVFVDPSRRRSRRLLYVGWLLAIAAVAYLAVVLMVVSASPDVPDRDLPAPVERPMPVVKRGGG